jgi:hypothetical protein
MDKKKALRNLVLLFSALYYIGRIAIFGSGVQGNMEFEEEQSELIENVVLYSFLVIGVLGLVMLPGLYAEKKWGFYGTVGICLYTIAFDIWAATLVQPSAAAGIIPAAIIMVYLLVFRKD